MATEPAPDTVTQTATKLKLDPPEALEAIPPTEAAGLVPLKSEETTELDSRVAKFVDELAALDSNRHEFGKKVDQVTAMGRKEIAEAAGASNRFLDRPVKAIDKDTGIGAELIELRRTVESLDPKEATKTKKLLGIIPFGNRIDRYFDKYRSSQTHIKSILSSLGNGKDELLMDNAAIDTERANLWKTMHKLEQMIHISKTLDQRLEDKANDLEATDPAKAKAIRETALFYTRQRTTDLLTQMAVTVQGYLALDLVKKNNVELVKGVDRASTTTVSALRTAVTVAQAMTNQKLAAATHTAERAIARFERVTRQIDERGGPVRAAARRERQRLNADLTRRVKRAGIAIGLISIVTILVGFVTPIGMFGFLAAVGLAIGIAALLAFSPSEERSAAAPSADLPNGEMVQRFDSYLYRTRRALPAPAQAQIDAISAVLPPLRQTL